MRLARQIAHATRATLISMTLLEDISRSTRPNAVDETKDMASESAVSAARRGDVAELSSLSARELSKPDASGIRPMHVAAEHGSTAFLERLVESGVDREINKADEDARLPIHFAAWKGHHKTVESLLLMGSFCDTPTRTGWTPLHYAGFSGSVLTARALLTHSAASLEKLDESMQTPLDVCGRFHADKIEEFEELFDEFRVSAEREVVQGVQMESFKADLRREAQLVETSNLESIAMAAAGKTPANGATALTARRSHGRGDRKRIAIVAAAFVAFVAVAVFKSKS